MGDLQFREVCNYVPPDHKVIFLVSLVGMPTDAILPLRSPRGLLMAASFAQVVPFLSP